MCIKTAVSAIQTCPLLVSLTEKEMCKLAEICEVRHCTYGEDVFSSQYEGSDHFFIVASGLYRLHLHSNVKKELRPGDIFGEIAIFHEQPRTGVIHCLTEGQLLAVHRDYILQEDALPRPLRCKLMRTLASQMAQYFHQQFLDNSMALIQDHENKNVEMKEAMSDRMKIVETMAGMMNAEGGTIFIGASDRRRVVGIKIEKQGHDAYKTSLSSLVALKLGASTHAYIHYDFVRLNDKELFRIDIDPSRTPIYVTPGNETKKPYLVVRQDANNKTIRTRKEECDFLRTRFPHYKK